MRLLGSGGADRGARADHQRYPADKLEQNRRETGNVIGMGANKDEVKLVRKGA